MGSVHEGETGVYVVALMACVCVCVCVCVRVCVCVCVFAQVYIAELEIVPVSLLAFVRTLSLQNTLFPVCTWLQSREFSTADSTCRCPL